MTNDKGDDVAVVGRVRGWLPALVVVAGVLAHCNGFGGVFLFDDQDIVRVEHFHRLWPIGDILFHRRRPVVNLSLAVNYALGKLDVRGYHALNLGVHLLAGLTLFGVVRRTVISNCGLSIARVPCPREGGAPNSEIRPPPLKGRGTRGLSTGHPSRIPQSEIANRQSSIVNPQSAPWLALAVSLIWVVHPLQTQSVTYIIQRAESLMGLFYLLTLYCVIRGSRSPGRFFWYVAAVAACALGMGSKGVMVTAPLVVLLYDRVFLSGSVALALRRRGGLYLGLSATWGILVVTGVVRGVLFSSGEHVGFGYTGVTPLAYALTQPGVLVHYLRLSLWPHPLCLDYGWPVAAKASAIVPAALALAALVVGTLWALWRKPWLGFVGAWFFLILAPTSSFIPIRDLAFEHRMYLPLASVVMVCVASVHAALGYVCDRSWRVVALRRWVGGGLVLLVVTALAWATGRRNQDYHSKEAMWRNVVAQRPDYARARYNLGCALEESGRFSEALESYRQTVAADPNYLRAHYNMGNILASADEFDLAVEAYRRALRIDTRYASARVNLGNALQKLGKADQAVTEYDRALQLNPRYEPALYNLGKALFRLGDYDQAIAAYRAALQIDPTHLDAYCSLGNALLKVGRVDESIEAYRQAVRLKPDYAPAHYNIGVAMWGVGKIDEAIEAFRTVLSVRPDDAAARQALASALAERVWPNGD